MCLRRTGTASLSCGWDLLCHLNLPSGKAEAGEWADEAAEFEFEEVGGDGGGGEAGDLDNGVDGEFVAGGDGGEDGGFLGREFGGGWLWGVFRGGFGLLEGEVAHVVDDVGGVGGEGCAFADELVAACGGGFVDGAGDGEDGFSVFGGEVGGDEGSGPCGAFGDEECLAPCGDDAVAHGEGLFVWGLVEGEFGDDGAVAGGDFFGEGEVFWWVEAGEAGADDGDGASVGGECGFVCGGVDAAGEA